MPIRHFYILFILLSATLFSCHNQKIESGETLQKETTDLIRSLGMLGENELIIKYYSNYEQSKAGNFFTTKRIAHYWLDDNHPEKNDTSFAFYSDIAYIDTFYKVPDTYAPYMTITRKDSTKFNVYVEASKSELKSFFEDALLTWKKNSK
jgi:hypothetical protein